MNKEFKIKGSSLMFICEGQEVFQLNINELLGFSDSLPWQLHNINMTQLQDSAEKIKISGVNDTKTILAEAIISQEDEKFWLDVTFKNISDHMITNGVMQVGMQLHNISDENVTIPHNIYHDNPSADPKRLVPHIGQDGGLIVEEHRLPIPAVNIEWKEAGTVKFVTLFSIPETGDCEDDKYWSMGALKISDGICIQALSGQTMFNGIKDMVYAGKNAPVPFERGYKLIQPNQMYQKRYCIDFGCGIAPGRGFLNIIDSGYEIFKPKNIPKYNLEKVISMKTNCLDSRYHSDGNASGYLTFGSANSFGNKSGRPDYFLYGWTGQAIKLAWCDMELGIKNKEPFRIDRAVRTVDFYASNAESKKIEGMLYGYYLVKENRWMGAGWNDCDHFSSRIQGEAVYDMLDVMLLMQQAGYAVPKGWEETVNHACRFLMDETHQTKDGFYPLQWDEDGIPAYDDLNSSGISCVIALAKAYEYFGDRSYLDYAAQKLQLYYDFQMAEFKIPFCRATMDARCEDKEAGIFFFLAAYEMYKITKEEKYKDWASVAGSWILTFVYFWETGFKKGSYYEEKEFSTTGWPGVSVQNHHLDVFFPCYEMYEFGSISGSTLLENMGRLVSNAFSHGICTKKGEWGFDVVGEQTEQFYPTNFFMSNYPELLYWVKEWRSGIRIWNPSWIIAQVLKSSIQFLDVAKKS